MYGQARRLDAHLVHAEERVVSLQKNHRRRVVALEVRNSAKELNTLRAERGSAVGRSFTAQRGAYDERSKEGHHDEEDDHVDEAGDCAHDLHLWKRRKVSAAHAPSEHFESAPAVASYVEER